MPKDLKEDMRARLEQRAKELSLPGFVDQIADETIATTSEALLAHLEKVKHPALAMEPLM
jgi:acetyl-CoA synthase